MSSPSVSLAAGGIGAVTAFYKVRRHLTRVAEPDRVDPARHFWLFKLALLAVIVAAVWWMVASVPSSIQAMLAIFSTVVASIMYFCGAMYVNFRAALRAT